MAAAELNNPVSLMHAPGVAQIFRRRQWRTARTEKYEGLVQSEILLRVLYALEDSTNTDW